jgi:hypothetical protein
MFLITRNWPVAAAKEIIEENIEKPNKGYGQIGKEYFAVQLSYKVNNRTYITHRISENSS